MKSKRYFVLAVVMVLLVLSLVGCNKNTGRIDGMQYDVEYKHVTYNNNAKNPGFMYTDNNITINKDYTYVENVTYGDNMVRKFTGNYHEDARKSLFYVKAHDSDVRNFKNQYRTYLTGKGITRSDFENIYWPAISGEGEIYFYKEYLFKMTSVAASRQGVKDDVVNLDGLYNFTGVLDGQNLDMMYLKNSNIYKVVKDPDFKDKLIYNDKPENKIGEYTVKGDFIEIKPTVATSGGKVNKPMQYLLADIVLPVVDKENGDKIGNNDVITVYNDVHIKVLVSSFYTTRKI